jgi:hypothetical protein
MNIKTITRKLWNIFGYIMLGAIYFFIIVPIALIRKCIRKPGIKKRFDPTVNTYRIYSTNAQPEQLEKPF